MLKCDLEAVTLITLITLYMYISYHIIPYNVYKVHYLSNELKCDLEAVDSAGYTPLQYAARMGFKPVNILSNNPNNPNNPLSLPPSLLRYATIMGISPI